MPVRRKNQGDESYCIPRRHRDFKRKDKLKKAVLDWYENRDGNTVINFGIFYEHPAGEFLPTFSIKLQQFQILLPKKDKQS